MPIKEGWEVPPNKQKTFEQIVNTDAVGDPILTSKCHNRNVYGFLVVSDRGITWRKKLSGGLATVELAFGVSSSTGSSIWIRWHDVSSVNNWGRHPNIMHVEVNKRKKGELLTNKRGIPKTKIVNLTIKRNQKDTKIHFKQREAEFSGIMKELFSQYQTDTIPPTSDSRT